MKTKYLFVLCVAGILIILDQITKLYIHTNYDLHESTQVIQGFFNITYVRNYGAAFGFLADSHPTFREIFFLSIPPIAVIVILWMLRSVSENDTPQILAFSLILSGAIGNYIDRIRFRYVIDFLDFYVGTSHWPAFNIADSAIVCGVSILTLLFFRDLKNSRQATT